MRTDQSLRTTTSISPPGISTVTGEAREAEPAAHRGGRAATRARGEGVARASLPDLDADAARAHHLGELDVGPVGERRVAFEERPEGARFLRPGLVHHHYAVRVPTVAAEYST